ncbi:MAG: c-type cytochrome [Salinarimonas sp.]
MSRVLVAALAACALSASAAAQPVAGDPQAGRTKAGQCRTCHGIDGIARIPTAPHIAGENFIYLQSQLRAFRSGKRQHEIMSIIAATLSDADIDDLSAWYASIAITATLPE